MKINPKSIWIDTETSGLSPVKHGIISLSVIVEEGDKVLGRVKIEMNPMLIGKAITSEALEINGYTIEQIERFQHPRDGLQELLGFLKEFKGYEKFSLFGYNVAFDMRMLIQLFDDLKMGYFGRLFNYHTVCVFELVKLLHARGIINIPGKHKKLVNLCKLFDIQLENAHDSDDDIEATRELYHILWSQVGAHYSVKDL